MEEIKQSKIKEIRFRLDKDVIIIAVLLLLVVFSGYQTFTLTQIATGASLPSSSQEGSSAPSVPSGIQGIPSQVGGC